MPLLAGCVMAPDFEYKFVRAPNPVDGKALLYVFRPVSELFDPGIYLNGTLLGRVSVDGYTYVYLDPGRYVLSTGPIEKATESVEFTIDAGAVSAAMLTQLRGRPQLSGFAIAGKIVIPTFANANATATASDKAWGFLADIYATRWYRDLQRQLYQPPLNSHFTPMRPRD